VGQRKPWSGTASELLEELGKVAGDQMKAKEWPKKANSLSNHLRRLAPNLRKAGIEVTFERSTSNNRTRNIKVEQKGKTSSGPSGSSGAGENPQKNAGSESERRTVPDDDGAVSDDAPDDEAAF